MDTIPFHWDTPDALQCPRMACLCPDECHEGWLCSKLLCFTYLLATTSATCQFSQCQRRHRRRNKCPPAAKVQALRGARLKALLALDFCLGMRGRSHNSTRYGISAWLFVQFIQAGQISVVFRAIHLTVNMPIQICVAIPLLPGAAKMRVPARGTIPTSICGRVSTAR